MFIDALPPSWDEDYVRIILKKFGEIEKIELARNMPAARRKDYGFVTFGTHDAATRCAESITGTELGEGDKKVCAAFLINIFTLKYGTVYNAFIFFQAKVRARLSRPLQRGRGKHVGRGDYRPGRGSGIISRPSWNRPAPRSFSSRGARGIGSRVLPVRSVSARDRRPIMSVPVRSRPLAPPARAYDRRPAGM